MHKRADAHRDRHTALQEEGKNARLQGADFKTDQKEPKEAWTRWCKLPNSSCAFLTHFIWASCRLLSTPPMMISKLKMPKKKNSKENIKSLPHLKNPVQSAVNFRLHPSTPKLQGIRPQKVVGTAGLVA